LTVAGLGRHKNTIALVRALKILHQSKGLKQVSLVVTGNDYGARGAIESEAERLGLAHALTLPGYVDARDLPTIYACAAAYASVSRFEGFGLTVLEAMACGAPVVISNCASLPEVAGDAALVVEPDDTGALAEALFSLIANPDLRSVYVERGARRAAQFSWDTTARLTLKAYLEAAGVAA
jgi:glycosyltransferase involved in cell wall biosynthesis